MEIIEQTLSKLSIRKSSWSLSRLLWVMLWTGVGLAVLFWSGPAKLDCPRGESRQITCRLSKPGWLGLGAWQNQTIFSLEGVELMAVEDDGVFYQILLQTSESEIPLRPYKTSGLDNTKESFERIQRFLNDPKISRLSIAQVDWLQWAGLIPGIFLSIAGLQLLHACLFSTRAKAIESYEFDRSQGTFTYQYGGLLRQDRKRYPFAEIQQIILDIDLWTKAWLFLEMRSGEVLCLNGQINLIGKSPGQRVSWQQRHGKYEMYIWLPKPGADWQSLSAIADDISHRVHRPYQLALGFWQRSLQQHMAQSRDVKRMAKLLKADLNGSYPAARGTSIYTPDQSSNPAQAARAYMTT